MDVPHQGMTLECGVFMFSTAIALTAGGPVRQQLTDMNRVRVELAHYLVTSEIPAHAGAPVKRVIRLSGDSPADIAADAASAQPEPRAQARHLDGLDDVEMHHGGGHDATARNPLDDGGTEQQVMNVLQGRGAVATAHGSQIVDERLAGYFNLCHLDAFPYGLDGGVPRGVSLTAWADTLMRRAPREQHAGNALLVCHMFDVINRRTTNLAVTIVAPLAPDILRGAAAIPEHVVKAVATTIASQHDRRDRKAILDRVGAPAKDLARSIRRIGGKILLTDAYYAGCHSRYTAAHHMTGPITSTFNVNPADMYSTLMVKSTASTVHYEPETGRPTNLPQVVQLWRQVASNPSACAWLLVVIRDAIQWHIFGFKPGDVVQRNPHCWAGRTLHSETKVEQTGRMALHFHGGAQVLAFAVERLRTIFVGPNCGVLALANTLVSHALLAPYRSPPIIPHAVYTKDADAVDAPPRDPNIPASAFDFLAIAGARQGDQRSAAARETACKHYHCCVVCGVLTHGHTSTCKYYGCKGVDGDCRLVFPRCLRCYLRVLGEDGLFPLPRTGVYTVPHTPAIALAFGCNHLTSLCAEMDRELTPAATAKMEEWLRQPEATRGECPLGRAEDHARDAARYAAKYVTKKQVSGENDRLFKAASIVEAYAQQRDEQPAQLLGMQAAMTNMRKAMMVSSGQHANGLAMMAYVLMGHSTFEATFETAPLSVDPFTALALEGTAAHTASSHRIVPTEDRTGLRALSDMQDYLLRGDELCGLECSWALVKMTYQRARLPASMRDDAPRARQQQSRAGHRAYHGAYGDEEPTEQPPTLAMEEEDNAVAEAELLEDAARHADEEPNTPIGKHTPAGTRASRSACNLKQVYELWRAQMATDAMGARYLELQRQAEKRAQEAAERGEGGSESDSDAEGEALGNLEPITGTWEPDAGNRAVNAAAAAAAVAAPDDTPDINLVATFNCNTPGGAYAFGAAAACPRVELAPGHGAGDGHFVRAATTDDIALLRQAKERLTATKNQQPVQEERRLDDQGRERQLRLRTDAEGRHLQAWVTVVDHAAGDPIVSENAVALGTTPPYLRLATPPTIEQTIQLFTMAADQGVAFMQLARVFLKEARHEQCDPVRILIFGGPGTGKSQVVKALLCFVFQHGYTHWMATTAFMWSAVLVLNTPVHHGVSTCSGFQLEVRQHASDPAGGGGAYGFDEISVISPGHFGGCNRAVKNALRRKPHITAEHPAYNLLAGRSAKWVGDLLQHIPPGERPIYTFAAHIVKDPAFFSKLRASIIPMPPITSTSYTGAVTSRKRGDISDTQLGLMEEGITLYRSAHHIFMLEQQQLQAATPSGRLLTQLASMFSGGQVSHDSIMLLLQRLNARVITNIAELAPRDPRAVILTNEPRHAINTSFLKQQAQHRGKRLTVFKARHERIGGPPLNTLGQLYAASISVEHFEYFTPDTWYFEGAKFLVLDNEGPAVGACHNTLVEAAGMLTDPREPPDNGAGPFRRLQYPPIAIFVRPLGDAHDARVLAGLADFDRQRGAFAVVPRWTKGYDREKPPREMDLGTGPQTEPANVKRYNVPLGDAYAVTGYYCQGASFGEDCWIAHLTHPRKASSAPPLEHIRLLRPLYPPNDPLALNQAVKAFTEATALDDDLRAEMKRLREGAAATRAELHDDYELMRRLIAKHSR
ncbi:hypothetical protein TSOC_004038 [Tetrabaena socialis]|uniref:Uncharacterized protein n=1 Tax=Tetrabaena socialis TaxID=47790 RepID=A0A2J8AA00_9CHLO|nr:hypothetical protein TSOC_004038 [Tetrabaena socialis]|eukprot:PNH09339.1 hypothetical protein TSOC_004038 [Tetrabaena socialis]